VRAPRVCALVHAAVWALWLLLVYADTVIFGMFRYHFNGLVVHEMFAADTGDAIHLDARLWAQIAVMVAVVAALEWAGFMFIARRAAARTTTRRRWIARPGAWAVLALAAIVIGEKVTFAWADLVRNREITARGRLFPLYQPLTVNNLVGKRLGFDPADRPRVELAGGGLLLQYPLEAPRIDPAGARPNILIIVADSLRHDMLDPKIMPVVERWSHGARVFDNHLSGGNSTRFGLFSLIYGIHGTYWAPVLNEQTPPVLITALAGLGYDLRVLSSASMSSPEFRSTAWVTMEDAVEDRLPEPEKWQRDDHVARRFDEWLGERSARGAHDPFFAFTLLDSPHQTYSVAPDLTPFEPWERRLDYIKMSSRPDDAQIALVKNRYLNSVAHADRVIGRMLDALAARGVADNTIVVVTGDHGEEFFEHGFFGHTSNYTAVQTWVTFVMRGPGIEPGVERRPTSHLDLAPTLLELLGADPAQRERYSTGLNLLAPPERRLRAIAGWQELALWLDGGILYVPLEGHKGLVEGFDFQWRRLADDAALRESGAADLKQLALECRRFLR
jgi:membrane-anchored protein YejM (alkaline phosphatase superfamily)